MESPNGSIASRSCKDTRRHPPLLILQKKANRYADTIFLAEETVTVKEAADLSDWPDCCEHAVCQYSVVASVSALALTARADQPDATVIPKNEPDCELAAKIRTKTNGSNANTSYGQLGIDVEQLD